MDDLTPLEFLKAVYTNEALSLHARLKAAAAAAPFVHPKFAVIAQTTSEDLVERLEKARAASAKVINARPVQVLSPPTPKPVSEAQQVSEEHMKRPMASLDTGRFRRI